MLRSSACLILILLLVFCLGLSAFCSVDDKVVTEYVMTDFRDASGWAVKSLNGSTGSSSFKDRVLTCDFSGHPGYIGVGDALGTIPGKPLSVTLTYESNKSGHPLVLRFVDSENQYFQKEIAALDTDGRRSVTVAVNDMSGWVHYGGKNDGVVRGQIKPAEIIVDHDGSDTSVRLLGLKVRTEMPVEQGIEFRIASRTQGIDADTLHIEARSLLGRPVDARYYWRVTDFAGASVDSGREKLSLAPGASAMWSLRVLRKGIRLCDLRLDADIPLADVQGGAAKPLKQRVGASAVSSSEVITVSKSIPTSVVELGISGDTKLRPESAFGMGVYLGQRWSSEEQEVPAEIAQDIGVKWMRDEFNWGHLEPEKGKWNWERLDHSVETATEHGISVFGLLCYWAPWTKPYTQEGINDYCDYVRTVVGRYKDRIKYWEIWNEPNIGFWTGTTEQYAVLLKAAYRAVKEADPDAKVIGCCTAGTDLRFIEKVLQSGDYDNMDILSIHPYRYPPTPEETDFIGELKKADALLRRYGKAKPIWITEIGWPTNLGSNGSSESKQAAMIARTYMQAIASGVVQKVSWYNFRNDGLDMSYNEHNFGIIRRDQSPKPACIAFRTMTRQLEGKRFVKAMDAGSGVCTYMFEGQGTRTLAAWCTSGTARLSISENAKMATDLIGEPVTLTAGPRHVIVPISEYPIFIAGVNADVKVIADSFQAAERSASGHESVSVKAFPVGASKFGVEVTPVHPLKAPADVTVRVPGYADQFKVPAGGAAHREVYALPRGLSLAATHGVVVSASVDTGAEVVSQRSKVYYVECRRAPKNVRLGDDLGRWSLGPPIEIGQAGHKQALDPGKWHGADDLSARIWTAWDDSNFYVLAKVTDDFFHQTAQGGDLWQGDSLQFALDALHIGARGPGDVYEIGLALTPKGPQVFSWLAPAGRKTGFVKGARLIVKRDGRVTSYQAAIPVSELTPLKPKPGTPWDSHWSSMMMMVKAVRAGWSGILASQWTKPRIPMGT